MEVKCNDAFKINGLQRVWKYYTEGYASNSEDIPIYAMKGFQNIYTDNLPARLKNGFVVVEDLDNGEGFHCFLYRINDLLVDKK